jgi:RNA polymerase sigma-70 factor (ECF subfamily)
MEIPQTVGAESVAREILARGTPLAPFARPAIVNGTAGAVVVVRGRTVAVVGFTVVDEHITAIDLVSDAATLSQIEVDD